MLDIEQGIVSYLERAKKLSLPGMGLIRYSYQPADLLRYTRRILPPRYKIEFIAGAEEPVDDFIRYLSSMGQLSESEAQSQFSNYLTQLKARLTAGQSCSISQVGTFRYIDNKIVFEEDKNSYLLAFNIGYKDTQLPAQEAEKIAALAEKTVPKATPKPSTTKGGAKIPLFVKIGLSTAAVILVVFFVLARTDINRLVEWHKVKATVEGWISAIPWLDHSKVKNIEELRRENRQALAIPVRPADSTVKAATVDTSRKEGSKQLVYHIIAGSYKNRSNAEQSIAEFQKLGFRPSVLNFNDTLFRVSLVSFADRQKAVEEYIYITQRYPNLKIWFYSRYE